ncbi:FAD-dependent oxidoreductase [uncultured Draconibacterium sp.]|uniref:FAD-dependent oxidoreductase n=1 Tax=uncultured Draconibacterium sp. TaxID=1573823 RepID=UPI0025EAD20C|nr:FAD-dependent oxidoreductase [uncultured Draconibacterium sp.]
MMKRVNIIILLAVICQLNIKAQSVLLEAESFTNQGGWVVDQQFIHSMGSPYLLAHGYGEAVEDASTKAEFPGKGKYHFWVRTKDWVPDHPATPGMFKLEINGKELKPIFGTNSFGWQWVYGGAVKIKNPSATIKLKDLTGFEGRCDAIYFSKNKNDYLPETIEKMADWREDKLGLTAPSLAGDYDLVVVGGGLAGCCAAVAAARQGLQVALINDRPVLGGNASKEVRVHTEGLEYYTLVQELNTSWYPNGDKEAIPTNDTIMQVVEDEKNIDIFLNTYINKVKKEGEHITEVQGFNTKTAKKVKFKGNYFVDATGNGWVGYYAGAQFMMGREAKDKFNESMAPDKEDKMTMGNSVLWNSFDAGVPSKFPEVPWATEVAKDYKVTGGEWFWEYGMHLNTIYDAEEIRDHLFRAIYGTWSNVKADKENANLKLEWVAYIAGTRESRRIVGEYILTENDVVNNPDFEDGFVVEQRDIDIHYPKPGKYDFISYADFQHIKQYKIPYRCLISKDIPNLFLAGRCFSASHVGLGSPRVMHTTAQMGVVVGYAATICKEQKCLPIDVYSKHLPTLRERLDKIKSGAKFKR